VLDVHLGVVGLARTVAIDGNDADLALPASLAEEIDLARSVV